MGVPLGGLSAEERLEYEREQVELDALLEANPLAGFVPHSVKQREFLEAVSPIQAAFAGNRFGKTTALVVKCLVQHSSRELLPGLLRSFRFVPWGRPAFGRFLCPTEGVLDEVVLPEVRKWCPLSVLRGGAWDKAWDRKHLVLHFVDGGRMSLHTYKQDPTTMVGSSLDYVAYDEPPPEPVRNECLIRLVDRAGVEMFAMTPVNMRGGGIGWVSRKIWKRREHPDVTVVKASIRDNPLLSEVAIERVLAEYPEEERRAREFGDFVNFGGMVYPGGFDGVLTARAVTAADVAGWEVVVGLDPGLKNAAFVWVGVDSEQRMVVFAEALLREGTPADYARVIGETNARWGVREPTYVIDPSARNRSLVNAESVEAELGRLGIFCVHGQNAVEAGVQQIRRRLAHGMLLVSAECRGLRDEAEEYRAEDRADGEFRAVKENDHRLDALRYAVMHMPWGPEMVERPLERLGWVPGTAPPQRWLVGVGEAPPLGSMS